MTNEIIRLITSLMNRVPQSDLSSNDLAEVRTALEKQIPKKATEVRELRNSDHLQGRCSCGHVTSSWFNYCPECGQFLDWSGE